MTLKGEFQMRMILAIQAFFMCMVFGGLAVIIITLAFCSEMDVADHIALTKWAAMVSAIIGVAVGRVIYKWIGGE